MNKPKVCIIYGWSEGSWHGKQLRKSLHDAGFTITKRCEDANILIAHSGGCFMLPNTLDAKLVLLVGLPYWPGKRLIKSVRSKLKDEPKNLWWIKKIIVNTGYIFIKPKRWYKMWLAWKSKNILGHVAPKVVIIRNDNDHFLHPEEMHKIATLNNWFIKLLPGQHDDIWTNPSPYVKLVSDTYNQLAEDGESKVISI